MLRTAAHRQLRRTNPAKGYVALVDIGVAADSCDLRIGSSARIAASRKPDPAGVARKRFPIKAISEPPRVK
jgi:hypothetical protein